MSKFRRYQRPAVPTLSLILTGLLMAVGVLSIPLTYYINQTNLDDRSRALYGTDDVNPVCENNPCAPGFTPNADCTRCELTDPGSANTNQANAALNLEQEAVDQAVIACGNDRICYEDLASEQQVINDQRTVVNQKANQEAQVVVNEYQDLQDQKDALQQQILASANAGDQGEVNEINQRISDINSRLAEITGRCSERDYVCQQTLAQIADLYPDQAAGIAGLLPYTGPVTGSSSACSASGGSCSDICGSGQTQIGTCFNGRACCRNSAQGIPQVSSDLQCSSLGGSCDYSCGPSREAVGSCDNLICCREVQTQAQTQLPLSCNPASNKALCESNGGYCTTFGVCLPNLATSSDLPFISNGQICNNPDGCQCTASGAFLSAATRVSQFTICSDNPIPGDQFTCSGQCVAGLNLPLNDACYNAGEDHVFGTCPGGHVCCGTTTLDPELTSAQVSCIQIFNQSGLYSPTCRQTLVDQGLIAPNDIRVVNELINGTVQDLSIRIAAFEYLRDNWGSLSSEEKLGGIVLIAAPYFGPAAQSCNNGANGGTTGLECLTNASLAYLFTAMQVLPATPNLGSFTDDLQHFVSSFVDDPAGTLAGLFDNGTPVPTGNGVTLIDSAVAQQLDDQGYTTLGSVLRNNFTDPEDVAASNNLVQALQNASGETLDVYQDINSAINALNNLPPEQRALYIDAHGILDDVYGGLIEFDGRYYTPEAFADRLVEAGLPSGCEIGLNSCNLGTRPNPNTPSFAETMSQSIYESGTSDVTIIAADGIIEVRTYTNGTTNIRVVDELGNPIPDGFITVVNGQVQP